MEWLPLLESWLRIPIDARESVLSLGIIQRSSAVATADTANELTLLMNVQTLCEQKGAFIPPSTNFGSLGTPN
jgi:hypothetical protein